MNLDPNAIPEAYERLLLDVINGDASLFTRADQTEISWDLFDPILDSWQDPAVSPLQEYEPGSWGPRWRMNSLLQQGTNGCRFAGNTAGMEKKMHQQNELNKLD